MYSDGELVKEATFRKFRIVQKEGTREGGCRKKHMGLTSWENAPDGKLYRNLRSEYNVKIAIHSTVKRKNLKNIP